MYINIHNIRRQHLLTSIISWLKCLKLGCLSKKDLARIIVIAFFTSSTLTWIWLGFDLDWMLQKVCYWKIRQILKKQQEDLNDQKWNASGCYCYGRRVSNTAQNPCHSPIGPPTTESDCHDTEQDPAFIATLYIWYTI